MDRSNCLQIVSKELLWLPCVTNSKFSFFCLFVFFNHCLTEVMATANHTKVHWKVVVILFMLQYISLLVPLLLCPLTYQVSLSFSLFVLALVISAAELEQLGSYTSWVHGLPHLRWGQSSAAEVHPQAWQVRPKGRETYMHMRKHTVMWPKPNGSSIFACGLICDISFCVWLQRCRNHCTFFNIVLLWIGSVLTIKSQTMTINVLCVCTCMFLLPFFFYNNFGHLGVCVCVMFIVKWFVTQATDAFTLLHIHML